MAESCGVSTSRQQQESETSSEKISGKAWGRVKKFFLGKTGFPRSIYFIVGNEFCERFSYYGMKAILILYLTRVLRLGDDTSTAIFHSFSMLCYFTPLIGAMIADSWLGKYRTILYVSFIYALGNLTVSLTALPPLGSPELPGPMIGLLLIAFGTGGIKPCVSAFGGDQFSSDQEKLLQSFFSVFYFAINAGSLLSMLITPVLRGDVQCFGQDCYPLAFGVPALLMLLAIALFWFGRHGYRKSPPMGNIVWLVFQAVGRALKNKFSDKSGEKKAHWMDWAADKYDTQLIEDIKALCQVLYMFLPLPVFWALFDQQGSRWVLQAGLMNGDAGFLGTLKPDQMQALNALFIILLIPLFEGVIYPLFKKPRPLKRMSFGMLLALLAFVIAGLVQMKIQDAEVVKGLPSRGLAELQFINSMDCTVTASIDNKTMVLKSQAHSPELVLTAPQNTSLTIRTHDRCGNSSALKTIALSLQDKQWYNFVISYHDKEIFGHLLAQDVALPPPGKAKFCVAVPGIDGKIFDVFVDETLVLQNVTTSNSSRCAVVNANHYVLRLNYFNSSIVLASSSVTFGNGGVYTVIALKGSKGKNASYSLAVFKDLEPKSVSMLWQVPQYFVITSGEILFSITGLEFAYSQAPASMKSCLQAAWLLTVAFGNLIVVIEAESRLFVNQAVEFFFFAAMLGAMLVLFVAMSYFYKYVESPSGTQQLAVPVEENDDRTGILRFMEDSTSI